MSNKVWGLFCFDGPLYKDTNGEYCSTTLTNEMFSRFFSVVDNLYIVVRIFDSDKTCAELNMKPLVLDHMKVIEVGNVVSPRGLLFEKPKFEKRIEGLLKKTDLIFARMPSVISDSVCQVAKKMRKPYLVEVGGCAWDSYWNHSIPGKIVAPLMYYWEKKYVRDAAFATYVTKEFLQRRYPNSGVSTNCSNVYLQPVDESVLKDRLRNIHLSKNDTIILGQAVASIDVKYKGEHLIVRALKDLREKGIDARYMIVGPGNGEFIEEQAKLYGVEKYIKFLGAMKKEEIFEWLKTIDIYVQPSKQEGLPRSVIEAMSVGCPAIGSNIAGIPELLDEDCLFNPDNNSQIVAVIENLLNKEKMIEKARANFERAKEYNLKDIELRRATIFNRYLASVLGE